MRDTINQIGLKGQLCFWLTASALWMWLASQEDLPDFGQYSTPLIGIGWWLQYLGILHVGKLCLTWFTERAAVIMEVDVLGDHLTVAGLCLLPLAMTVHAVGGNPLWAGALIGGWMLGAALEHLDEVQADRA